MALVRKFVIDAITTWEKRIDLISIHIYRPEDEKLRVDLTYKIKELNIVDTFYYTYTLK
jgi:phage baseplate assembly protein W